VGHAMVSMLASSVLDRDFDPLSGKTKYYKIGYMVILRLST